MDATLLALGLTLIAAALLPMTTGRTLVGAILLITAIPVVALGAGWTLHPTWAAIALTGAASFALHQATQHAARRTGLSPRHPSRTDLAHEAPRSPSHNT